MTLYEMTVAAESALAIYKHPNLDDWIAAIDPVLKAAGEFTIGRDTVADISISNQTLTIETHYSVRGCAQANSICIPLSVIQAENPLQAATGYRLNCELTEARANQANARNALEVYTNTVDTLEAQLSALYR